MTVCVGYIANVLTNSDVRQQHIVTYIETTKVIFKAEIVP